MGGRVASLLVVGAVAVSLAGCATATSSSCEETVANMPPIVGQPGLDYLTSDDLAATLAGCDSVAEWTTALRAHPEVVDAVEVTADDAVVYLTSACDLLPDEGESNAVCTEAREQGILLSPVSP